MNILNFTLTDLRYLTALYEEKHFAKAAERSFVSQPTLSIAIKKLEENLGIKIFERQNHDVITTSSGQKVIDQAYKILSEANNLNEIAKLALNPYSEPLRIGAIFTIGPYIFPQFVRHVVKEIPELKLLIEENYTNVLLDKLMSGMLDVIILATPDEHKELIQIDLFKDDLDLICSKDNKLAKYVSIKLSQLEKETFLMLGSGHCLRDQVIEACPTTNQNSNQFANLITSSSLETIKYMVEMDLGISILPRLARQNLSTDILVKKFGKGNSFRMISLVYRKNYPHPELIQQIAPILINSIK
ncbi:MAG: LysR substrate-binding domain-containing protein [Burkholderiales bacterium]|nr:LysR substrate-binding domain-containing protein [Burkholderiales bacterium]